MKLEQGLIQIYTGNGKGKTTAAIGQGMRAYGNGLKVKMIQFLKSGETGELNTVQELSENFKIYRFERPRGFTWTLDEAEIKELQKDIIVGYKFILEEIKKGDADVLIIDEIMAVISGGFLDVSQVLEIMEYKPKHMELIMTGRNVPLDLVEKADLVTEMREIKHYYNEGVPSRKGIEY